MNVPKYERLDIAGWHSRGMDIRIANDEAARLLHDGLVEAIGIIDSDDPLLKGVKKLDSNCFIAKAVKFYRKHSSQSLEASSTKNSLVRLEKVFRDTERSEWEHLHWNATQLFVSGRTLQAVDAYHEILLRFPLDLFANDVLFVSCILSGLTRQMLETMAMLVPHWKKTDNAVYGYMMGRYAYALQECCLFDDAKSCAAEALRINKYDAWAHHAMAHVMECTGRASEGLQHMRENMSLWSLSSGLACHNYWHTALFHHNLGQYTEALLIWDEHVAPVVEKSQALFPMSDAASLLLRLQCDNVSIGNRWNRLVDMIPPDWEHHRYAFYEYHVALIIASTNRDEMRDAYKSSLLTYMSSASNDNVLLLREIGLDVVDAILKFFVQDYAAVVDLLYPKRNVFQKMGGSVAQADILNICLYYALLGSTNAINRGRLKCLLQHRSLCRKNDGVAERILKVTDI